MRSIPPNKETDGTKTKPSASFWKGRFAGIIEQRLKGAAKHSGE
jgi:hypothetical protein